MLAPNRRSVLLLASAALMIWIVRDFDGDLSLAQAWRLWSSHAHLILTAFGLLALAFNNEMTIELTMKSLNAGHARRRRYFVRDITNVRALAKVDDPGWWHSWLGVYGSSISQVVQTGIRITLATGKTVDISSANPDHLSAILADLLRQEALREINEPEENRLTRTLRRWTY